MKEKIIGNYNQTAPEAREKAFQEIMQYLSEMLEEVKTRELAEIYVNPEKVKNLFLYADFAEGIKDTYGNPEEAIWGIFQYVGEWDSVIEYTSDEAHKIFEKLSLIAYEVDHNRNGWGGKLLYVLFNEDGKLKYGFWD